MCTAGSSTASAATPRRANGRSQRSRPAALETSLPEFDREIVIRVDLEPEDFEISNNKTLAVAKGDASRVHVQVWNLGDTARTGRVEVAGAVLDGLPPAPCGITPFDCAAFDCLLRPLPGDLEATPGSPSATLVLQFAGEGRRSTRLTMPVFFEKFFLESCEVVPLDWKNPAKWVRNDSADDYSVVWDEAEQALRFDVAWKNPRVGRWFYPALALPANGPDLSGALRVAFEVKSAQDKVENDFDDSRLMLVRGGKGGLPSESLRYLPPTGAWERRHVDVSALRDLDGVEAIRLGANPRGMRLTFWVRNISVLKARETAAEE